MLVALPATCGIAGRITAVAVHLVCPHQRLAPDNDEERRAALHAYIGASFATFPGMVITATSAVDGSVTQVLTGHNVVFLFPTDIPAGPSTTLFTGQVVIDIDPAGTWTVVRSGGTKLDICAQLSG